MKKKNTCNIGGQAVLEGVMMRGASSIVTAVRDPKGEIVLESSRFTPVSEKSFIYRVPIIRGMIAFFNSFVMGIKTLNRASEVYGDMGDMEPSKFEKWIAKTFKVDIMSVFIVIAAILGIIMGVGLFIFIPQLATTAIFKLANWEYLSAGMRISYNLIAGFIRMSIFIGYIAIVSLMKDIKRLFMYHGSEHKTISCYESGMELTVENAQKMTTVHDRCGTTFMFIVMVVSILFFAAFPVDLLVNSGTVVNFIVRVLSRIILVPIVAGISYEFLKLFAKYDNIITRILKKPGLWLQKLTTKEPDDSMVEVAIASFKEVIALEADKDRPLKTFITYSTVEKIVNDILNVINLKNEAELIIMHVVGAKTKTELYDGRRIDNTQKAQCLKFASRRAKGAPLQYVLGTACFYGYDFEVDSRVLIPRFDTEILVEKAISIIKEIPKAKVLDLCTGSGAIAISIAKNCECELTATDVSEDAIFLAKKNAETNNVSINFKSGSLFLPVKGNIYDVIISNPPYIQTGAIPTLDNEVKDYEPMLALNGGADGLNFYRDIISSSEKYLNKDGYLIFEVGMGQSELVREMMLEKFDVEIINDYNNPPIPRVLVGKLKNIELDK
jgi:release factor-specific protein-(glutamine-N5) methyltransferase